MHNWCLGKLYAVAVPMRSKIVNMVGRKDKKSFVVDCTDESCTTPQKKQLISQTPDIDLTFDNRLIPLTPDNQKRARVRVEGREGQTYVQMMTTSSVSIYVNESPDRKPTERKLKFAKTPQRLFQPQKNTTV